MLPALGPGVVIRGSSPSGGAIRAWPGCVGVRQVRGYRAPVAITASHVSGEASTDTGAGHTAAAEEGVVHVSAHVVVCE